MILARTRLRFALAQALVLIGPTAFAAPAASTPKTPPTSTRTLQLFFSNDIMGELEPCGCRGVPKGGILRRARYIELLKISAQDRLQLDAGDLFFQDPVVAPLLVPQSLAQARALAHALDRIGLDAFVPGERDLALGLGELKTLLKGRSFSALASNFELRKSGQPVFARHLSLKRAGRKIVIIGVMGSEVGGFDPSYAQITSPVDAVRKEVLATRPNHDLVIVLSHLGLDGDRALAKEIPGIDMIIGGHSQSFLQTPLIEGQTSIAQASYRGEYLGHWKIRSGSTATTPVEGDYEVAPLTEFYDSKSAAGAQIEKILSRWKTETAKLNRAISPGDLPSAPTHLGQTFVRCAQCHEAQFEFWRKTPHARALDPLVQKNRAGDRTCLGCHSLGAKSDQELAEVSGENGTVSVALGEVHSFLKEMNQAAAFGPARLQALDRAKITVQCEHCHGIRDDHPMTGKAFQKPTSAVCKTCHTPTQAPAWYIGSVINPTLFKEKLRAAGCPVQPKEP